VGLLRIQWLTADNQGGKPMLFAGPLYDPSTRVFKDSMQRSAALKIIDTTTKDLFAGKEFPDLFTLHIDDQLCISSESFYEKDRTVKLGTGKDLSIDVDKTSVNFNESNLKMGEMINVDNRSGYNQTLGVSIPVKGLLFFQIVRKPEQSKVPKESWERFTVDADSGVFIVLIPEPDPAQLAALNGKEITIKVWDGNKVRETRRIPITVSSDLSLPQREPAGQIAGKSMRRQVEEPHPAESSLSQISRTADQDLPPARQGGAPEQKAANSGYRLGGLWLWAIQIFNLALLLSLGAYGIFFMLPKIQVLEDRLAKNEMFIHGSREAIREELEEIKEEILRQCRREPPSE
jgi:hypothetical protein